jgi:hypothetical protein
MTPHLNRHTDRDRITAAADNFVTVDADDSEFSLIKIPDQIIAKLPNLFQSSVSIYQLTQDDD